MGYTSKITPIKNTDISKYPYDVQQTITIYDVQTQLF